ncbi:hypothetical protein [Rhizobium leguminosarum]|uniref:hypothetical protein n=1 Tax=Rhizobium leguminosarum TaxID=384 RepID=UPI0013E29AB9|nr:hypothetical protein [Rhizobium leguminosarum]
MSVSLDGVIQPTMKRRVDFSGSFNGPEAVPRTIDIGAINAPSGHIWLEWAQRQDF